MKKYFISLFSTCFALFLALSLAPTAEAAAYTDIEGHWNQAVIEKWSDSGILNGYADGTFRPNNPVTRGQLTEVLYRIHGSNPVKNPFTFKDVGKDLWCYDSISAMTLYGITLNQGDKIYPDEPLTREEAFYMIAKTFCIGVDQDGRQPVHYVSDAADIADRYTDQIDAMLVDKYVNGSADGKLNPKRPITRAEVMKVIDNIIDVYISKPGEYTTHGRQNVLITCGGVTIRPTLPPADYVEKRSTRNIFTYVFGDEACDGGVTFTGNATKEVYCASSVTPRFNLEGGAKVSIKAEWNEENYSTVDTRFSGGNGRKNFPYIISTPEQFKLLAEFHGTAGYARTQYFKLADDIDLGTLTAPIGLDENQLIEAHLDGGGHTVTYRMKNVAIDQPFGGLFYAWKGFCSNLNIAGSADVYFTDKAMREADPSQLAFGGFAGSMLNTLENCSSSLDITARCGKSVPNTETVFSVGGLVGKASTSDYSNCHFTGDILAIADSNAIDMQIGGLTGVCSRLTSLGQPQLVGCSSTGSISSQGGSHITAGGLVGLLSVTIGSSPALDEMLPGYTGTSIIISDALHTVTNCWSTAKISSSGASIQSDCGGLVGQLFCGTIKNSWAKPTIQISGGGFQNAGGIAGKISLLPESTVSGCWADATGIPKTGDGDLHPGGIVGRNVGYITDCYVIGAGHLKAEDAITYADWNDGVVDDCSDLSGKSASERKQFFDSLGGEFMRVWISNNGTPLLRDCDAEQQRKALGI